MGNGTQPQPQAPGTTLGDYVALTAFAQMHGLGPMLGYYHLGPETWDALRHHWDATITANHQQPHFASLVQSEIGRIRSGGRPYELGSPTPEPEPEPESAVLPAGLRPAPAGTQPMTSAATLVMEDLPPAMLADLQKLYADNIAQGPAPGPPVPVASPDPATSQVMPARSAPSQTSPAAQPSPAPLPAAQPSPAPLPAAQPSPAASPAAQPNAAARTARPRRSGTGLGVKLCGIIALLLGIASAAMAIYLAAIVYPSLFEGGPALWAQHAPQFGAKQTMVASLGAAAVLVGVWPLTKRFWFAAIGIAFGLLGGLLSYAITL